MGIKRRKHRITRIRVTLIAVLALVIAAAVLLGVFRIHTVEVSGNERYTAETIQADLIHDFWTQNTLYFAWKYRNAGASSRTPYLDSVQVKLISPGRVRIIVKEKKIIGGVQYAGNNVYFDESGTVLEISDKKYDSVPMFSGITMEEPILYQKLLLGNGSDADNATLRSAIKNIALLLIGAELIPDNISFDENQNITLTVGTVEVKLGKNDYMEAKVANLAAIYPQVASQTGTLNLEEFTGKNEPITFKPSENAQTPETETDSTESDTQEADAQGDQSSAGSSSDNTDPSDVQSGEDGSGTQSDGSQEDGTTNVTGEVTGIDGFMVFDSSGTLRYDARVINGQVVDGDGNVIDGCYVNDDGNVVDAYWNVIDPQTGQLAQ